MKIVRIVTRMNIGGPSTQVTLLTNRLDRARFSTSLLVGRPHRGEGDRTPWVQNGPAKVIRIDSLQRGIHPVRDLTSLIRIFRILCKERPELIHTHMAKAGALGRMAGWLYNLKRANRSAGKRAILVHTFHGHVLKGYFSMWTSWLLTLMERWLAQRTDCLVAVSPSVRNSLLERKIGRGEQWQVVPLGLELSALHEMDLPNGALPMRCGLVGRLVPIKNPSLFLSAVEQVLRNHSERLLQAVIIGDGPLRPRLEKEVRTRHLEGAVAFTGWRTDLRACYGGLDIVCLTSWNEGTPLSLIEAMAAGRVAVASDVGGVRDLLGPLQEGPAEVPSGHFRVCSRGILFRGGDARGLAAALEALAREPALRRTLAEAGRSYALAQFSHRRLVEEVSFLYERLNREIRKKTS